MGDMVTTGPAQDSDRILEQARASLVRQQAGGRRVDGRRGSSIGARSAELKRRHMRQKAVRITTAVAGILFVAMGAGLVVNGIGFTGVMLTFFAIIAAVVLFSQFPRLKTPERAVLNRGSVRALVGNTELWLENQRRALPAPAVQIVDQIGVQLDALGLQLEGLDEKLPAVGEVRKLVGEHLPELISAYTSIPAPLRQEARSGQTPDAQVTESLGKISAEIDSVTRQLAAGAIDNLAIRTRFLDYKYGEGMEQP